MQLLKEVSSEHVQGLYMVLCPGCKTHHQIHTRNKNGPNWSFNGDMVKPTFSPSLLVKWSWGEEKTEHVCHSFIRDGVWQFLGDCTHDLKGQNVPMIEVAW
jgi:hypothetical protein